MAMFSILLPTRNRLDLLKRAIQTVLRQDFEDWEIIISDNCSDEDIQPYVESLNDSRIRYQRTDSFVPVTDNWNRALDASRGDYVIMLGDDDALLRGYLSGLHSYIQQYDNPDAIYTSAALYAYPKVMQNAPNGFLKLYNKRPIFNEKSEPFLLDQHKAKSFVEASLQFQVLFDYNMQFFAVSRKLIDQTQDKGSFFQSPYPDYYAANVTLLTARQLLVVPQPMIAIGISPKSFGYYYFGGREKEGTSFLNNLSEESIDPKLRNVILPGTDMNTCWLIAMKMLSENYRLSVKQSRYRELQIRSVFNALFTQETFELSTIKELRKKLSFFELFRYYLPFKFLYHYLPKEKYHQIAETIMRAGHSHDGANMVDIEGHFETILDVYDQFDPLNYVSS